MLQRKCPKCETGIMSDLYTAQGWGKEGFYVCDSCEHCKNIYEGKTIGPYIFFIIFEVVIFFLENRVSLFEYSVYGTVLLFLIYRIYRAQMYDTMIENDYAVIGEFKGEFEANEIQKKSLKKYMTETLKTARKIKIAIALSITVSYSIMLYFEESLDYIDYIGFGVIGVVLPVWLVFTKFEGE
jgi:hypothetical protein